MGVPVVLVYLGFLNVDEMPGPFTSAQEWEDFVRDYSRDIIPEDTWASKVMVNGTPIYPVIRSLDHQWM